MGQFLVTVLQFASYVFIARALLSWIPIRPGNPLYAVVDTINRGTEPILEPIRRALPSLGGFDLSIFVVIIIIRAVLIPLAVRL